MSVQDIIVRRSKERGHADHGWLNSYHTFSFADYHDPAHMQFRSLRVINEDRVAPGMGFGAHPHRDMEIFSYVIEGALAHKDSMGHESIIKAGDVQKITAGTGITHSEYNASKSEQVHFLQIWILPQHKGLKPSYQEYSLALSDQAQDVTLIGSSQGGDHVIQFNQDVYIYKGKLARGKEYCHDLNSGRGAWLQMIKGEVTLNEEKLTSGDGAAIEHRPTITVQAVHDAEFILMDLA